MVNGNSRLIRADLSPQVKAAPATYFAQGTSVSGDLSSMTWTDVKEGMKLTLNVDGLGARTVTLGPPPGGSYSTAVKVRDELKARINALGADIVTLDATLESKIPSFLLGIPGPAFDVGQKFKGFGWAAGFNAGLLFTPVKSLSLGVAYRSQVKIDVDGEVAFSTSPLAMDASTTIKLPQQVSAGVAYRPTDRLTLEVGTRWEDWASFPNLTVDIAGFGTTVYPRDWHGTWAVNVGGTYRLNDAVSLLAGYLYGWNPVPDSTFEPSIPDSNTQLFCVGTDLTLGKVNLALSYGYQRQTDRAKLTNLADARLDPNNIYGISGTANGTYENSLHMVAVSLGYHF